MKRSLPAFIVVTLIGLAVGAALAGPPTTPERDVTLSPASIGSAVPSEP